MFFGTVEYKKSRRKARFLKMKYKIFEKLYFWQLKRLPEKEWSEPTLRGRIFRWTMLRYIMLGGRFLGEELGQVEAGFRELERRRSVRAT